MSATDIVGYTYKAEQYTPAGIIEQGIREEWLSPGARGMRVEDALDQAAAFNGIPIDRAEERSFDSDEFPKVIFESDVEPDELFRNEHGEYVHIG